MPAPGTPSVRFRRIGLELRRLRVESGMSLRTAAAMLERSASSVSLIENGLQPIRPRDLEYILGKFGYDDGDPFWQAMLELAREGRRKGWWHRYSDTLSPEFMDFLSLESDARGVSTFQTVLIPGLLQTPGYAKRLISPDARGSVRRAVEVRTRRQAILSKPEPLEYNVVLAEAALRQLIGGAETMRGQLAHLVEISQLDHIHLQVVPFACGKHQGLDGPFTILEVGSRGKLTVVTLECLNGISYLEDSSVVRRYTTAFQQLTEEALSEPDSRAFMERLRSDL